MMSKIHAKLRIKKSQNNSINAQFQTKFIAYDQVSHWECMDHVSKELRVVNRIFQEEARYRSDLKKFGDKQVSRTAKLLQNLAIYPRGPQTAKRASRDFHDSCHPYLKVPRICRPPAPPIRKKSHLYVPLSEDLLLRFHPPHECESR